MITWSEIGHGAALALIAGCFGFLSWLLDHNWDIQSEWRDIFIGILVLVGFLGLSLYGQWRENKNF